MPFTTDDIALRQLDATRWQLLAPVIYKGSQQTFTVPAGFDTDLASVPQAFVWLIPRYGLYTKSAVLHDYLLSQQLVSRSDADGLFRRSMRELGVPFLRRWLMWCAVRYGSRLEGATPGEFSLWLLITVPSVTFLLIPAAVVVVWLAAFWIIEISVFLLLRPFSHRRVNLPRFTLKLPRTNQAHIGPS